MKKAGILMPMFSIAGKYYIGDFGYEAYQFIDKLKMMNIKIWQLLPLNPVGYGNSPYQSFSSFAGEVAYISVDLLVLEYELDSCEVIITDKVDYKRARDLRISLLKKAYKKFVHCDKYFKFINDNPWLKEYSIFMVLKEKNNYLSWNLWTEFNYQDFELDFIMFCQYVYFCQFIELKKYANSNGIKLMGDVAFYVGYDSVEVYNNRSFFELDYNGDMLFVAGVGPDYFSSTGQLWGNPLYLWDKLKNIDYKFIIDRINLDIYDIIRIDHFRAFDSYYKIAFGSSDAKMGKWVKGPGEDVVERLKDLDIEVVVEDLGLVPKSVYQLRDKYGLTHMKIVQFLDSFDEQFCENSIIYTGTHDNQTLVSWYEGLNDENKKNVNSYFKIYDNKINVNKILINYTLHANSKYCIISIVDLLCLSDDERINKPGTIDDDNWSFKLSSYQKLDEVINDVSKMVKKARR